MSNEYQFESPEFRQHIRALLYEYSVTHYTTNYITFTEDMVSEVRVHNIHLTSTDTKPDFQLLQALKPVPLTDPYSFIIPVDPFQTFSQIHALSSLPPYDEILQTTNEARLYLKDLMHSTRGVAKTSRLEWTEPAHDRLNEPFFPALTRHSRKQTPRLGKVISGPGNLPDLLKLHKVESIAVEHIADEKLDFQGLMYMFSNPTSGFNDDIFAHAVIIIIIFRKVKHHINPSDLSAVQVVLKHTADSMRKMPSYKNRYLDPQFLCKIDLKAPETPEEQFMPIFPRSRLPGHGTTSSATPLPGLKSFADFPTMLDTDIKCEDIDGDLSMQNLVIVSGWQAIQSSPPSTPSVRGSDSEDQHDQLLFPSSPDTEPPLVEEINKTKMGRDLLFSLPIYRKQCFYDTHLMTTQRGPYTAFAENWRDERGHAAHISWENTFLQPLLLHTKSEHEHVLRPRATAEERQNLNMSPTLSSLLGQAASEIESSGATGSSIENPQGCPLDDELKKLYQGHSWDEVIMNEPLDDKQPLLMEVPILPEPNVHPPNDMEIPKIFADFLIPASSADKYESNPALMKPEPAYQFLKKVKGKQALALALSWVSVSFLSVNSTILILCYRPFTVDKKLPSVVELVGVADLFESNNTPNGGQSFQDVTEAEKLIGSLDHSQDGGHRFSWSEGTSYRPVEPPEEFQLLLNRQERRRVAKLGAGLDEMDMNVVGEMDLDGISQSGDVPHEELENPHPLPDSSHNLLLPNPQAKRQLELVVSRERFGQSGVRYDDEADDERAAKRPRLEVYYESSPADLENVFPLPAYDEHEHGRVESGYESPGAFFSEENKENWPPLSSSSQVVEDGCYPDQTWNGRVEYDPYSTENQDQDNGGGFEPLSFDSRYLPSGATQGMKRVEYGPEEMEYPQEDAGPSNQVDISNSDNVGASINARDEFVFEPDIASHSLGMSSFAQLRARKLSEPTSTTVLAAPIPVATAHILDACKGAPEEIFDKDTIVASGPIGTNLPVHRYMASLDFIQKHGLVRALRSEGCAVELVERQTLGGVDLIVDPYCAVLFISLFTLPARCAADVARVTQLSWKFPHLLVVFEAYPESHSKRFMHDKGRDGAVPELYAYTPPIIKAIKKFRRDISITDACGTKRSGSSIQYGFADSVQDAALITRVFGCQAEERDETFGVIWGERPWLSAEFIEEEEQLLAGIKGMNHFSASMILSQITLEEYVELVPEERMAVCSGLIVQEALFVQAECSADIESRFQAMSASSDLL
ncbi:hypothetical protein CVT25_009626 [Psilocybe cyanescens]|uniref:Uncharacterized protein n=1 Tax=Psilocybe cyanescens TaxID=93625 RepID=A0A409XGV4_PSICY|nr:hypothetical protein CVT25_009626 [Psilocybe cyanescens]